MLVLKLEEMAEIRILNFFGMLNYVKAFGTENVTWLVSKLLYNIRVVHLFLLLCLFSTTNSY